MWFLFNLISSIFFYLFIYSFILFNFLEKLLKYFFKLFHLVSVQKNKQKKADSSLVLAFL